jgi:hypothetical protein
MYRRIVATKETSKSAALTDGRELVGYYVARTLGERGGEADDDPPRRIY